MPTRDELYGALRNADKAGDAEGARKLAAYIQSMPAEAPPKPAAKPFGEQLNDTIHDLPRQAGLAVRHGIEGLGGSLNFLGTPLRAVANGIASADDAVAGAMGRDRAPSPRYEPADFAAVGDSLGLPTPKNAGERIAGDATKMLAGALVPLGAAGAVASRTAGTTQAVARMMAANPLQQLASAGAAGTAGGYTRETGGDGVSQTLASLAGGVAAPAAMGGLMRAGTGLRQMMNRPAPTPAQIDIQISRALGGPSGLSLGQLAPDVHATIRNDVAEALKVSDDLDPVALRRLIDYRTTGTTPTVGKLTRDPATFTQEENLMRVGANSKDKAAQTLGSIKNTNNTRLIDLMNETGASTSDDAIGGAQRVIDSLKQRGARADQIIGSLYDKARDSTGRSAQLDHYAFTQRAGDLLHEANVESFLTPDIRNKLNGFAEGRIPLTVEIAEQFKTGLGRLQRNSTDGNVRFALGKVRQALDETPLLNESAAPQAVGGNQLTAPGGLVAGAAAQEGLGQEAIAAFNKARSTNRAWRQIVEKTPALQAVEDGVEPDKFVQQFIVGAGPKANVADVAALRQSIKTSPEAMGAVKSQIASTLKKAALSGASDEVGTFSQSGYNKAFDAIGERKMRMFFSPEEIDRLKAIGRVASYEQKAPAGEAIGRSNTAAAGYGILDRIIGSSLLTKIPLGRMALQEPIENIVIGQKAKSALDATEALTVGGRTRTPLSTTGRGLALSPALLTSDSDAEEKR